MTFKSYSELLRYDSFEKRFEYLKLNGVVGTQTFGPNRWINQLLYRSSRWINFRDQIIIRDNGCDLGIPGCEIHGSIIVHHINPICYDDIILERPCVFDPENVISTKLSTHNAIHFGDRRLLEIEFINREKNDTCPWKNRRNK